MRELITKTLPTLVVIFMTGRYQIIARIYSCKGPEKRICAHVTPGTLTERVFQLTPSKWDRSLASFKARDISVVLKGKIEKSGEFSLEQAPSLLRQSISQITDPTPQIQPL